MILQSLLNPPPFATFRLESTSQDGLRPSVVMKLDVEGRSGLNCFLNYGCTNSKVSNMGFKTTNREVYQQGTWCGAGPCDVWCFAAHWSTTCWLDQVAFVFFFFILFYRAGVYWIHILSIPPGCLKGNFQYTPALEKRMAMHFLESGWIGKYAPLENLHPSALEIALGQYLGPRGANCLWGRIFQLLSAVYYNNITILIWLTCNA